MNELVQKALQQTAASKKESTSVPWQNDKPWPQPYHRWDASNSSWTSLEGAESRSNPSVISGLQLYTWNIDFMLPFPEERMTAALSHLQDLITKISASTAVIICLQECTSSDLNTVSRNQWIRDSFYITDVDDSSWASRLYGKTMLIDRRLQVSSCFRVHFSQTRMERDGLFADLTVQSGKTLRICNTHLESLALEPQYRPPQMKLIAEQLHAEGVSAGIVTGDFNAIQPADATLHTENDLKDAYLELGGRENGGQTWGQQALPELKKLYGLSRMDKVFFCGDELTLQSLERIGADVEIDERYQKQRDGLLELGFERPWITDHLGLKADFNLEP